MDYPYPSDYESRFEYDLLRTELVWRDHYYFLLQRGYRLRPRYEPGWQGSWLTNGKKEVLCEDRVHAAIAILDAIRVSDGTKVALKLVHTFTQEIPIGVYFSSGSLRSDPRNRCVPILDVVLMPNNDDFAFIVMPVFRRLNYPPFEKKLECIEAFYQMLEGIEFMHEHHVAHRDSCYFNFLMDSSELIPGGFHFALPSTYDGVYLVTASKSREEAGPMRYYWIDFGLSSRFPSFEGRRLVVGTCSQEKVPELSLHVPYDPFKVDIFQVGMTIKRVCEVYERLEEFMQPFIDYLIQSDPRLRPSASEALLKFKEFSEALSHGELNERVYHLRLGADQRLREKEKSARNKGVRKLLSWMSSVKFSRLDNRQN